MSLVPLRTTAGTGDQANVWARVGQPGSGAREPRRHGWRRGALPPGCGARPEREELHQPRAAPPGQGAHARGEGGDGTGAGAPMRPRKRQLVATLRLTYISRLFTSNTLISSHGRYVDESIHCPFSSFLCCAPGVHGFFKRPPCPRAFRPCELRRVTDSREVSSTRGATPRTKALRDQVDDGARGAPAMLRTTCDMEDHTLPPNLPANSAAPVTSKRRDWPHAALAFHQARQ